MAEKDPGLLRVVSKQHRRICLRVLGQGAAQQFAGESPALICGAYQQILHAENGRAVAHQLNNARQNVLVVCSQGEKGMGIGLPQHFGPPGVIGSADGFV